MAERNFMDLLQARWAEGKFVCVGLDSKPTKIPESVSEAGSWGKQVSFNHEIIEATADLVCAFKPNLAFYYGDVGKNYLRRTIELAHSIAPDVPVILDVKQGDIGNTNDAYVAEDFGWFGADAVTVNPYLGMEAMRPFLNHKSKGIIVLCRTSNPGAGQFQDVMVHPVRHHETGFLFATPEQAKSAGYEGICKADGTEMPLYQFVAHTISQQWNRAGNCVLVVGATYTEEMEKIREIDQVIPFLIPGIGKQGGDLEAAVRAGQNGRGAGMIINSSSGIIFASDGPDFAEAARAATQKMHDGITAVLQTT